MKRKLTAPSGDVRSGLFNALAEWAARQVSSTQGTAERAWKPNILVPVEDPHRLRGAFELVEQLAYPVGSVKLMGVAKASEMEGLKKQLIDSQQALEDAGVFTYSSVMQGENFSDAVRFGMQALSGSFFVQIFFFWNCQKTRKPIKVWKR